MRAPNASELVRLTRWRLSTFWVMLVGYIGYYLCRGNLAVALPLLEKEFHYTNTQFGIILTFSELAYALGKFTTGPLADKLGGKRIFIVGMVGAIVFNVMFPFYSSILGFTIIWCLCRYFLSMGWGGIIKVIGEWYEPERNGVIMGLISINFQFGSVLASVFCALLIGWNVGWRGLFFYPAIVVTVIAIWSMLASRESPQDVVPGVKFGKNSSSKRSLAAFDQDEGYEPGALEILIGLWKVPLFRQVVVFSFLAHLLRSIFLFWTPKLLVDIGTGSANAAMMSAVFPLLGCLGTVFLGWYTDHHAKNGDRARMMSLMLAGLFISLWVIAGLIPYRLEFQWWIVTFLGIGGFCLYGPYSMSAGCLSLDIAGTKGAGTCTGIIDGVGYIGGALAAWGAGVMSDQLGWAQVFVALALIALMTSAWTFYMSWTFRKRISKALKAI